MQCKAGPFTEDEAEAANLDALAPGGLLRCCQVACRLQKWACPASPAACPAAYWRGQGGRRGPLLSWQGDQGSESLCAAAGVHHLVACSGSAELRAAAVGAQTASLTPVLAALLCSQHDGLM